MDIRRWGAAVLGGVAALAVAGPALAGESRELALAQETNSDCVDVNEADLEELQDLKHVTESRAEEMITLRPFTSVDDLGRVDGLVTGEERLQELVHGGGGWLPLCPVTTGTDTRHENSERPQDGNTESPPATPGQPHYRQTPAHPHYQETPAEPHFHELPAHPDLSESPHPHPHEEPENPDYHEAPDQLPVTGSQLPLFLGAGSVLTSAGAGAMMLTRRRQRAIAVQ